MAKKEDMCDNCGIRPATVYVKENINGKIYEGHLCQKCMQEKEKRMFTTTLFSPFFEKPKKIERKICSSCQTSEDQFLNSGFLGCPNCYNAFAESMENWIGKFQNAPYHIGTNPDKKNNTTDTEDDEKTKYERLLKKAIEEERFEEAAMYRDKLKNLKGEGNHESK